VGAPSWSKAQLMIVVWRRALHGSVVNTTKWCGARQTRWGRMDLELLNKLNESRYTSAICFAIPFGLEGNFNNNIPLFLLR
jgi:hypothetical protein